MKEERKYRAETPQDVVKLRNCCDQENSQDFEDIGDCCDQEGGADEDHDVASGEVDDPGYGAQDGCGEGLQCAVKDV